MTREISLPAKGTMFRKIVDALHEHGPMRAAILGEHVDEVTALLARTMAKLRDRGLTVNLRPGGKRACYGLTAAALELFANLAE